LFLIDMATARAEVVAGRQLPSADPCALHVGGSADTPGFAMRPAAAAVEAAAAAAAATATPSGGNRVSPDGMMVAGSLQHLEVWAEEGRCRRLLRMRSHDAPASAPGSRTAVSEGNAAADNTAPKGSARAAATAAAASGVAAASNSGGDWLRLRYFRPYDRRGSAGGAATVEVEARPLEVVVVHCQVLQGLNYANHGAPFLQELA
jgi:hypothetical protein